MAQNMVLWSGRTFNREPLPPIPPIRPIVVPPDPNLLLNNPDQSSSYDILQHMDRMVARISILDLIKKSRSHQEVLSQFLQKVMVLENLPAEQISSVLMSLSPTPTISFYEHELALKEIHNLPVCMTLLIRRVSIDNILVDTRASVCVAPISTLRHCGIKEADLSQSTISILTFDNTRRPSLGAITLTVEIGPLSMPIEFHIVDVESPFNAILGWP